VQIYVCIIEIKTRRRRSNMRNDTLKTIITAIILIALIVVAVRFAVRVLFPIAVVIIAAYIVYMVITRNRR